jgi:FkbH-like protein
MAALTDLISASRFDEAFRLMLDSVAGIRSYGELSNVVRLRRRLSDAGFRPSKALRPVRLAFAGTATITYLTKVLSLYLETRGIAADILEVPYGSIESEVLQPNSSLSKFNPELFVCLQTPLAINDWPSDIADTGTAVAYAASRAEHMLALCQKAHERFGCEVVLDNWHAVSTRPHGSWARRMPSDRNAILRRMNDALDSSAPSWLHIHDVYALAACHGLDRWVDRRFWYHAKQPIGFDCVGAYASDLASTIAALYGASAKCLILDLDGTLWGGVIGDDGLAGIHVRQGDPLGEAFLDFQRYLLRLKQRGILLAVCSKNDPENARAPFIELPDMALRLEDFVSFKANWETKPVNIKSIADELNIGLDSIVFVDDNPIERAYVRAAHPTVRVVDLPADPADFPRVLDATGWLELTSLSGEDLARTSQYQANAQRRLTAAGIDDYGSFLISLGQRAQIRAFEPAQMERIAQLINKTNQFNLMTTRVTLSELEALARRSDVLTATVRLSDRFGDNGLIAVLYGLIKDDTLRIDQWLMSCRVFNRGVEQLLMNYVVGVALQRGIRRILGQYRPTPKNGIVRDLYLRLGFTQASTEHGAAGLEAWTLEPEQYRPLDHAIEIEEVETA